MSLSARAQKILASQRAELARFPYLIKICHPDRHGPDYYEFFYANSSEDIAYGGDIYSAASFSIQPPDRDGSKVGNATLTISAVDQFWIERIRGTQTPARLQFMAAIVYDGQGGYAGTEALEENSFTCRAASWNEISISWDLSFDERMGDIATSAKCTPMNAPGCA